MNDYDKASLWIGAVLALVAISVIGLGIAAVIDGHYEPVIALGISAVLWGPPVFWVLRHRD